MCPRWKLFTLDGASHLSLFNWENFGFTTNDMTRKTRFRLFSRFRPVFNGKNFVRGIFEDCYVPEKMVKSTFTDVCMLEGKFVPQTIQTSVKSIDEKRWKVACFVSFRVDSRDSSRHPASNMGSKVPPKMAFIRSTTTAETVSKRTVIWDLSLVLHGHWSCRGVEKIALFLLFATPHFRTTSQKTRTPRTGIVTA